MVGRNAGGGVSAPLLNGLHAFYEMSDDSGDDSVGSFDMTNFNTFFGDPRGKKDTIPRLDAIAMNVPHS